MNLLVFFDYVYYSIANLYVKTFNYEELKEFAGVLILSVFQLINCLTILVLFKPFEKLIKESIVLYLLGCIILLALNFIRYKKVAVYAKLSTKWDNESRRTKKIKIICVVLYCIISIILFITLDNLSITLL
jgi:hypothetical protein